MTNIERREERSKEGADGTPLGDFIMGTLLMAFSAGISYLSWSWPRPEGMATAPGLLPLLIGILMFFMSLSIFINALKHHGPRRLLELMSTNRLKDFLASKDSKSLFLSLFTVLFYMIVLLHFLPFEIGTFIYLIGSLCVFWQGKVWKILLISASMTAFYSLVFKFFFNMMLPGAGM